MIILVGSKNPVKIDAVAEAFALYFGQPEVKGFEVPSGVPNQPVNDQTFLGARNRVRELIKINDVQKIGAGLFVGIEGGIEKRFGKWFAFGAVCVADRTGKEGFGLSPHFELPFHLVEKLLAGVELGDLIDELISEKNSKQKGGAIGFFTNGVMSRKELYIEGLKTAVIPFLHKELFFND